MSFERLEHKSTYEGSFKIKDMPSLRLLSVQNCDDVDVLFDILKHSVQLRWLKIHFSLESDKSITQQKSFANNFWNIAQTFLHQICVLQIHNCDFLYISPSCSSKFPCLKDISLTNCNNLENFIKILSNLIALEELNFSKCQDLKHVPEGFGRLTCLKKLAMWECEALEVFPSGLSNLTALEVLNFSKCRALKHVPEGFGALTCLRELVM